MITRFSLCDFAAGVSDIAALQLLLESGARIRGVRNLHAKVYLFGASRVITTSANLTEAALLRNHEFGFVAEDPAIIEKCLQYFDDLWARAGKDASASRLEDWERTVTSHLARGAPPAAPSGLSDEGVDAGIPAEADPLPAWSVVDGQSFVKFFGEGDNRAEPSQPVLEEVRRSGCHWACTYPVGKRPRQVRDGAELFMGRLVGPPNDILIFGRACAMQHEPGRDDATDEDIKSRPWKEHWPHYVRVHHAEFVAGSLSDGISLNKLMETLGSDSFASTQRNAARGEGNIDPRAAYRQQPGVELTPRSLAWLRESLERAFAKQGKLPGAVLSQLDWPR